jgi:Tol biopolymer transport system component
MKASLALPAAGAKTTATPRERSAVGVRFDWAMSLLGLGFTAGAYLDGWAHNHGKVDQSFFTPWHGVLYGSALVIGLALMVAMRLGLNRGLGWRDALPRGYLLSLAGVVLFGFGGVADLIWHTLFGIEVSLEALLSPSHLFLSLAGVLIVSGPLRAAWRRREPGAGFGWPAGLPVLLSAVSVLATIAFMTQFAHPFVHPPVPIGPEPRAEIYVMNADGSAQTRLTVDTTAWSGWPAWSPDGRRIAFTRSSNGDGQIVVMNADGTGVSRLTQDDATDNYAPAWSPDGRRIVFVSRPKGHETGSDIYLMDADGSDLRQLTRTAAREERPAWSPDGARILFASDRDGGFQLYTMDADGGNQTRVTSGPGQSWSPAWSPDGRRIAFVSDREGSAAIYVMDADGGNTRRVSEGRSRTDAPAWSPDGGKIVFTVNREGNDSLYVVDADGGDPTNLSNNPGLGSSLAAWSPDGARIAYAGQGHAARPKDVLHSYNVLSIILQSALLMGTILLLVRRWRLPAGALTVLTTLTALLAAVLLDHYEFLPAAFAGGVVADLLLRWLERSGRKKAVYYTFAFLSPLTLYALYFLSLFLTSGLDWTVHLWAGAIVLAGLAGLLLSFVVEPPFGALAEEDGRR